jgi:hypothetical protein
LATTGAAFLSPATFLVYRCPRPAFRFILRHATRFITFSDVVCFANLLIGEFSFIATRHRPKHPFINERTPEGPHQIGVMRPSIVQKSNSAKTRSLLIDPVVNVLADRILIEAVAFLDFAFELFALAGNLIEVVIRKMTPLLLDPAL